MIVLEATKNSIKKAVNILKNGGTVVYPTETAYGIAGDPRNVKAKKTIFRIKKRANIKKLPLVASSFNMVRKHFEVQGLNAKLAHAYWPGPLSIILKSKNKILNNSAVRVPGNNIARELSRGLRFFIFSTSANLSGNPASYSVEDIIKQFKNAKAKPNLILDAGKLRKRKTSTIIKIKNGKIYVIREGSIKF